MNLFFVDRDPRIAAQSLVDKHVVKMILETAQLLSTAHRLLDGYLVCIDGRRHWRLPDDREFMLYKASYINHPTAKWVRASRRHYHWSFQHLVALLDEFAYRYDNEHRTKRLLPWLEPFPTGLIANDWSDPPLAMPEIYKLGDAVASYRTYYTHGKAHLHQWARRAPPHWLAVNNACAGS